MNGVNISQVNISSCMQLPTRQWGMHGNFAYKVRTMVHSSIIMATHVTAHTYGLQLE